MSNIEFEKDAPMILSFHAYGSGARLSILRYAPKELYESISCYI